MGKQELEQLLELIADVSQKHSLMVNSFTMGGAMHKIETLVSLDGGEIQMVVALNELQHEFALVALLKRNGNVWEIAEKGDELQAWDKAFDAHSAGDSLAE